MHEGAAPRIERGSRGSPEIIHAHLRAKVLSGEHPAGFELSQAQVAKSFGVSRGPVREAFRLLQRDGLIESEVNHRARVTSLSLQDVEHLYTLRIVNEALALTVSVPRFTADELDELDRLVDEVDASHGHGFEVWENATSGSTGCS